MDINLLIPFSKPAKKNAEGLKIDLLNSNKEQLTLTKTILTKIMTDEFSFPELDTKYMQEYFAFYPCARIILSIINKV